jgi:hypothetical protein
LHNALRETKAFLLAILSELLTESARNKSCTELRQTSSS